MNLFFSLLRLIRPFITLSVAFSALVGFIMAEESFSENWIVLFGGVMLVAAGASAFNQIQESRYDKLMLRTQTRPIPAGKISKGEAFLWASLLSLAGILLLWHKMSPIPSLLALITLFWYNLVYTPLKRKTAFAVIPGALVGALPPVIGWSAGDAGLLNQDIILVSSFFFLGQIPHFWLILLIHGKDYQKAGFPAITSYLTAPQIAGFTMAWVLLLLVNSIILPISGVIHSEVLAAAVFILSILLLFMFRKWFNGSKPVNVNKSFVILNIYFLVMMLILIADSLLR